jgi:hypothetical protein
MSVLIPKSSTCRVADGLITVYMSRPDLGERSPNDLETPASAGDVQSPMATWHRLASALVRPRMVANRFDHVAIVEPESVGKAWGGVVRSFTYQ